MKLEWAQAILRELVEELMLEPVMVWSYSYSVDYKDRREGALEESLKPWLRGCLRTLEEILQKGGMVRELNLSIGIEPIRFAEEVRRSNVLNGETSLDITITEGAHGPMRVHTFSVTLCNPKKRGERP